MKTNTPTRGHRPGRNLDLVEIRALMAARRLDTAGLAELLGVRPSTVRNVLAGQPVSLDRAADWARALGVRVRAILKDLDDLCDVL